MWQKLRGVNTFWRHCACWMDGVKAATKMSLPELREAVQDGDVSRNLLINVTRSRIWRNGNVMSFQSLKREAKFRFGKNEKWKLFNFNCNFMLSLNEHLYRGHVRFVRSNFSRMICNSVSKYQFETIVLSMHHFSNYPNFVSNLLRDFCAESSSNGTF